MFLDPNGKLLDIKRSKRKEDVLEQFHFVDSMLKNPNNTKLLYRIIWHAGSDPCHKVIRHCIVSGKNIPCQSIFQILPTSSGPCCTFNIKSNMYHDSPFAKVIIYQLF